MKSVTINDLEIRYDDSICDAYLEKVLTLIERYYEILIESFKEKNNGNSKCIISLVPTEDKDVFCYEDFFAAFNNFMEKTLRDIFKYYYVSGRYEGILPRYLEEYFNQEAKKKKINLSLKFYTGDISEKPMFSWLVVIVSYFAEKCMGDGLKPEEECIERCLDYINSSSGKVTNEIFNWVLSKYGLNLYDFCLGDFLKKLSARGLPNNILEIVLSEYENMFNRLIALGIKDDNEADDLENVDIDINNLFLEFLDYINAPSEWYDYYKILLEEKRLTYEIVKKDDNTKKQDEEEGQRANTIYANCKAIIKNGKLQVVDTSNIKIKAANKAGAFITLIHEFIHYVNWNKLLDKVNAHLLFFSPRYGVFGKDEYKYVQDMVNMLCSQSETINEFPSIFFEKIAASFLASKFSGKVSATSLLAFRTFDELKKYITLFYVWLDLQQKKEIEGIEEDTEFKPVDLNVSREKINKILDEIDFSGRQDEVGIKRIPFYVRRNCSREDYIREFEGAFVKNFHERLKNIVLHGDKILLYITYALGNFLAEYLTEQLDTDPTVVERMVRCVDEGTLSLDEIIREFNLYDLFNQAPPGFERKS